jgi:Protein of unknown function (DUF3383)
MKRTASALAALLLSSTALSPAFAGTATGALTVDIAAAQTIANNTMTVSLDPSQTAAVTNYPLQFGRPFLDGAVPSGQQAQVIYTPAGGSAMALPTQMDVKNRYPDGSVEYAVMAVVLPTVPAGPAPSAIAFQTTTADSNTPLTAAQMEAASYNFDAAMQLVKALPASLTSAAEVNNTLAQWQAITNGGFTITLNGTVEHVTGVNMSTLASDWSNFAQLLTATFPAGLNYSSVGGTGVTVLTTTATGTGASLSYGSAPTDGSQDISAMLGLQQSQGGTLAQGSSGGGSADALTMLKNGNYTLWTSGPVAQTIILADDSPAHAYDIGLGDGQTPFRPRFVVTFWPATNQVFVRAIGENDLTTELEDIGPYNLTITGGANSPATEQSVTGLTQPALSIWDTKFWLGGTPNPEVNVNYNLAYLESTRFVPNYDTTVQISQATIASDYANWWTNGDTNPINGFGGWQPAMGATGPRPDIGPEPSWDVAWLYTGDWRMAQTSLGNADLAAQWSANTRETDSNAILNRTDAAPASGQVGTGYGRPISITYRTTLGPSNGGESDFLFYNSDQSSPPNKLGVVGNIAIDGGGANANGWQFDAAHEPSPFFIPYILTGDPFYLRELENWAAYDATEQQGDCDSNPCRGPTGVEGGMDDQERGDGWSIRSRAEEAFAIPDSDPFKTYLTILMNETLARWEGVMDVTDPTFSGTSEYAFGQQTGNPENGLAAGSTTPSPIGQWVADTGATGEVAVGAGSGMAVSAPTALNDPWMEYYLIYSLGRAQELGFNAGPLLGYTGQYEIGLINTSGNPELIANFTEPVSFGSSFFPSWSAFVAGFEPSFLTGSGFNYANTTGLTPITCQFNGTAPSGDSCASVPNPTTFNEQYNQGYDAYAWAAMGMLVNAGVSGAQQADSWLQTNVYQPLLTPGAGNWANDPSWDILARTDKNVLPAQPLTPQ